MKTIHITVSPDMIENGYQPKTTFWMDFSIADKFGIAAIKDTYNRAFKEWKTNHVYLTELVMVLNHKIWQWYQINETVARCITTFGKRPTFGRRNTWKVKSSTTSMK